MPRTGTANLPLHGGRAPRWLFQRMSRLAREITIAVVSDGGPELMLRKLSDPFWFQALGCALGFDWHSSGVTTTVCGAIKEGTKDLQGELGLFVCGGKGRASRKTPAEILDRGHLTEADPNALVHASRISAKVDSSAVQDGFQVYHHVFMFTAGGAWSVVQQGMNEGTGYARRYHWLSETAPDLVSEPHAAVCCDSTTSTLNLVAHESATTRSRSAELAREKPVRLLQELRGAASTAAGSSGVAPSLGLPRRHEVTTADLNPDRLAKVFLATYEAAPAGFEELLSVGGVGAKSLRALALLSELLYGDAPSFQDPARYSFAHGGKDGFPYPVDREIYDRSIETLRETLRQAKMGDSDRLKAFKRLGRFTEERARMQAQCRPQGRT